MYNRFELHRNWVDTSGQEGEQLRLQDVDFREFDISDICLEQSFMASCTFEDLSLSNMDFHASLTDVDISEARFEGVLFYGVTLRNIKGIEEANVQSIHVGSDDKPIILKGQEARDWLRMKAEESI
jgi:uncharacterized protein YjbI with pentapeptide repeats